ncbi:MAG: hypothetical protein IJW46_05370 [Clostridia bacterium]|nr:hypothetical protein [Clostridia bacterium]
MTNKLQFFSSLLQETEEKLSGRYDALQEAYRQYRGEGELAGLKPATMTRNITYELIESEVSTDIPLPHVSAYRANGIKEQNARRIEALLAGLRDSLPFEKINDSDERMTYIYGGALYLVEWDEQVVHGGEVGGVKLTHLSPMHFLPQPDVARIQDMEYCFLRFTATKGELGRSYRLSEEEYLRLEGDGEGDACRVIVCFYKNEAGEVSRFIFSGDVVLSDIEDLYARKRAVCSVCGLDKVECTCGGKAILVSDDFERVSSELVLPDGETVPRGSLIRRYKPRGFPLVMRKNSSCEEEMLGQSDCLFIRPQQVEINKVLSRLHEKMMMAGLYPYKPDDCQFRYDNSIGGKVLNLRPGESPAQFGVLDTTPDITRDLAYIEATYRDAKRILGISDAYVGEGESLAVSGESRKVQVAQAEGRLASKRVMKNAAYAELDALLFAFYLAYADEPRAVLCRDGFHRQVKDAFSRYDFLIRGEDGIYTYDDDYHFSTASAKPTGDEREALWRENLENYRAGSFGPCGERESLARYWASQVECAYPGAEKSLSFFVGEKT